MSDIEIAREIVNKDVDWDERSTAKLASLVHKAVSLGMEYPVGSYVKGISWFRARFGGQKVEGYANSADCALELRLPADGVGDLLLVITWRDRGEHQVEVFLK